MKQVLPRGCTNAAIGVALAGAVLLTVDLVLLLTGDGARDLPVEEAP